MCSFDLVLLLLFFGRHPVDYTAFSCSCKATPPSLKPGARYSLSKQRRDAYNPGEFAAVKREKLTTHASR